MSIEGNIIKCDACGLAHRMAPTVDTPALKIESAAWKLGWKTVGERDYCPNCA